MPDPAALWEQATIYRDEWGVPHIQADNLVAMSFVFGYAQAEDHIEAMLKAYRIANGRAAEVYGEEFAASDEFSLKMGHADLALAAMPNADAVTRDVCAGFALGVNAWLVENPARAPVWADGVRPEDVLSLLHCYLMSYAPFDLQGTFARAPASNTGNAWAIGPSRSQNGETILVMNPHTDYRGPFQWYEAQLTCGAFNMYGATLFGLPLILQGHNGALGWALTPNMTDFADIYIEPDQQIRKKNVANPTGKRGGAQIDGDTLRYIEMIANAKKFFVRTPSGLEERQVPYLLTPRGPIVGRYNNKYCSYLIGGYSDFGALGQLFAMGSATNLDEFKAALSLRQLPSFHVLYADRDGNIFYLYNSKVGGKFTPPSPEQQILANRQSGSDAPLTVISWNAPVPAGDTRFMWGDIVALDALPVIENPKAGFVQACGNPPWRATENSEMNEAQWPVWFAQDADTFRSKRARRLLTMGLRSFQDAQAMLYDVLVPGAMYALPKLIAAADERPEIIAAAHPDLAPTIDLLRNWNYVAEPSSEGMTAFHVWWNALRDLAPRGATEYAIWQEFEDNTRNAQALSLQAAEQAARLMRSEFQTLNKPWGEAHVFVRGDKRVPAPGSTSGQPLFVASDYVFEEGTWKVSYGYGFAMAVAFGERTQAATMVPFGASEDPGSPHFDDQLQLMQDRRLKPVRFEPEDVRRFAATAQGSVVRIAPRGMEAAFTVRSSLPVTISSKIDTKPPVAIPAGLVTFTVYAQLEQYPADRESLIEMDVFIPEEVCAQANLTQVSLYAYDSTQGWSPLEAQELNLEGRVITGRDRSPRLYAVLGPVAVRKAANPFARQKIAAAVPDPKPLIAQAEATLPPPESATAPPPVPVDMIATPQGVPTMANPAEIGKAFIRGREDRPAQPDSPVPDGAPESSADAGATPSPAIPEGSSEPRMPVMQAGLPTVVTPVASRKEGALAWGTKMQLRPPGVEGLILVSAEKQVGARLIVNPEHSESLPNGLVAYTQFVTTEVQSEGTPVKITVHLRPSPETVSADHLASLKLYAYDAGTGWEPVAGQSLDESKSDFTGTDTAPRTYVLLGPQEHLLKQTAAR